MNLQVKYMLQQGISTFLEATTEEKIELISKLENNIKMHYEALNSIGVGYAQDNVKAGEIFLRIFKSK